ncbi:hypothetical protein RN49_00365 [Pantoea agglomerans]|nr:hypothetical protein RN49_00365 [Pantoea agglomerans]MBA5701460.1 hypothetical protein [Pantoea agglomerans]
MLKIDHKFVNVLITTQIATIARKRKCPVKSRGIIKRCFKSNYKVIHTAADQNAKENAYALSQDILMIFIWFTPSPESGVKVFYGHLIEATPFGRTGCGEGHLNAHRKIRLLKNSDY